MKSLRALGLYAALTVALTWPYAANLWVMEVGDPAFFAWEVGWTVHALGTDPTQLPHANIFYPLRYTLGLDEPVLGTTLLALPLALFTDNAVLLFNVLRLLTFVFSGLTAYWLARELGAGEGGALLGGAFFAFSPIRTDQMAHLSTLGTQWLPLVVLFAVRFSRSGKTRDALLTGLFYVLAFAACGYHGLIALAVLPLPFLVLLWRRWRLLPRAALATALVGLLLLPLYLMHSRALEPEQYTRRVDETIFYSAPLESFLATSAGNRIYGGITDAVRAEGAYNLFPGLVVLGLGIAGAVVLWRRRQRPGREAAMLAVMALVAALVAMGPLLRAFGHDLGPGPWALLRAVVPVFEKIRVTSRAGIFLALPLAMLAAKGLTLLRLRPIVVAVVGVLGLAETLIAPIPMPGWTKVIDTREEPPPVYRWLAERPVLDPIIHLPMFDSRALFRRPAFHESVYMAYSTLHWNPMVNGYAGIEPKSYVRIRREMMSFPGERFLDLLREAGVRYIVLHRKGYGPNQTRRLEAQMANVRPASLREVVTLEGDTVYELLSPGARVDAGEGPR
ncbi:MAG: hypothetical protein LJF30_11670 [Acidobacteria bacterium]|nr:hypothetical protein [Acidobacteriota bacterium]